MKLIRPDQGGINSWCLYLSPGPDPPLNLSVSGFSAPASCCCCCLEEGGWGVEEKRVEEEEVMKVTVNNNQVKEVGVG